MHIIIAGAGTVGYSLAKGLSFKHSVTIVDKEIQKLEKIEENLDVFTLLGDSEDPKTYLALPTKEADLFIAVTDSDEANLLSTLIVDDAITGATYPWGRDFYVRLDPATSLTHVAAVRHA